MQRPSEEQLLLLMMMMYVCVSVCVLVGQRSLCFILLTNVTNDVTATSEEFKQIIRNRLHKGHILRSSAADTNQSGINKTASH